MDFATTELLQKALDYKWAIFVLCIVATLVMLMVLSVFYIIRDAFDTALKHRALALASRTAPKEQLFNHLIKNGCIHCGSKNIIAGPSVGISNHYLCECGKKYKLTFSGGIAEEI